MMMLRKGTLLAGPPLLVLTMINLHLPLQCVRAFSTQGNSFNAFGQTQRVVPKPKAKPKPKPVVEKKKAVPVAEDDETVNEFIRSEYEAWVIQHDKTADDKRFKIFKKNFLATLETFETTGEYHALNKFADMTPEEYKKEPPPVDEVDAYVRTEWNVWREQYNKPADEAKYAVFKDNFLKTMKIFEQTGKFNALNEHGDMTREEFLRMQTHLAISSNKPQGGIGGAAGGQDWGKNPYNTPEIQQSNEAASYQRSEAMTFAPVTPRSTSDVLNSRGSSGTEYDIAYGIGGASSRETVDNTWGMDGGGMNSMNGMSGMNGGGMGGMNGMNGGGMGGMGGMNGGAMGGMNGGMGSEWGGSPSYAQPPSYAPSSQPGGGGGSSSFQRTEAMTFQSVSPRSTSDVLNSGGGGGGSQGGGLGSEWDVAYGRSSGSGNQGGGNDWNSGASGGNSWGSQETMAPMVGPPSNYPASQPDPYAGATSTNSYERSSEMTFTPVTPTSKSDVLNNNRGASGNGPSDWDIAYGYKSRDDSGALGVSASWDDQPSTSTSQPSQHPQPFDFSHQHNPSQDPSTSFEENINRRRHRHPPRPQERNLNTPSQGRDRFSYSEEANFNPMSRRSNPKRPRREDRFSSQSNKNRNLGDTFSAYSYTNEDDGYRRSEDESRIPQSSFEDYSSPFSQNRQERNSYPTSNTNNFYQDEGRESMLFPPSELNDPSSRRSQGTFTYMPTSPSSRREARDGINSFMGRRRNQESTSSSSNKKIVSNNLWDKMTSAVEAFAESAKDTMGDDNNKFWGNPFDIPGRLPF